MNVNHPQPGSFFSGFHFPTWKQSFNVLKIVEHDVEITMELVVTVLLLAILFMTVVPVVFGYFLTLLIG
ncbi:MAG: hypothetical protein HQL68_00675 [Magnetococcales bacterium]|nr:hypothetical protein [Magnetococcales bacterium]